MKLSIILATLFFGSLSFAGNIQSFVQKNHKCTFNPERYREVSFVQDFVLHDGLGNDYVEFKKGQSYRALGVHIMFTEYANNIHKQTDLFIEVPGRPARPVSMTSLDNMSHLRVLAWIAFDCK